MSNTLHTASTVKEKIHFDSESGKNGTPISPTVYSSIQNQGSKEWLLASDIPKRAVCCLWSTNGVSSQPY